MRFTVINSNSAGNAYILGNDREALLLECGVSFKRIKQALNFNLSQVVGCLVTHEHLDHCKAVKEVIAAGIDVYASFGTHARMGTTLSHRSIDLKEGIQVKIGGFTVKPFGVKHDAAEPLGFFIHHPECGTVLFLTDTYYSEYYFEGLEHVIIEANFCEEIIRKKMEEGETMKFLRDRIYKSHMSLQTCKQTLTASDLSSVKNIILIHLSDSHSDEFKFQQEVAEHTGKPVYVASPGLQVELSKTPF